MRGAHPAAEGGPALPGEGAGCRRCRSPTPGQWPLPVSPVPSTKEKPQRSGPSRPRPGAQRSASPLLPRASLGAIGDMGSSHRGGRCLLALHPLLSPLGQLVPGCLACATPGSASSVPRCPEPGGTSDARPESRARFPAPAAPARPPRLGELSAQPLLTAKPQGSGFAPLRLRAAARPGRSPSRPPCPPGGHVPVPAPSSPGSLLLAPPQPAPPAAGAASAG